MVEFGADTPAGSWSENLSALLARLDDATRRGANDAANLLERRVKTDLMMRSHLAGTPTPSPPGSPPAMIDGNLARSAESTPAMRVGPRRWTAKMGMTAVYSRIQELGGVVENGFGRGIHIELPPRPYLGPAERALESELRDQFVEKWREVIDRG